MTGDNATTANAVAKKVKVDEVIADVLPEQKVQIVKRLQQEGRLVAMAPPEPRSDAQHQTKSLLGFICNILGVPIAAGVLYPFFWHPAEPDDRSRRHEFQLSFIDW